MCAPMCARVCCVVSLTPSISVNVWWHRNPDDLRAVPMWGAELERKNMIEKVVDGRRLPAGAHNIT